jgi:hypothetical protein
MADGESTQEAMQQMVRDVTALVLKRLATTLLPEHEPALLLPYHCTGVEFQCGRYTCSEDKNHGCSGKFGCTREFTIGGTQLS